MRRVRPASLLPRLLAPRLLAPGLLAPGLLAPMLLASVLAGCGSPAPVRRPAVVVQPARPAAPVYGVDGLYRGTRRLVRSEGQFCPRSGPLKLEIERGEVTFAYIAQPMRGARPERVPLTAVVQPDGRLQASDGVGTLDGTLRNGLLEITVASQLCEQHWTLRRVS